MHAVLQSRLPRAEAGAGRPGGAQPLAGGVQQGVLVSIKAIAGLRRPSHQASFDRGVEITVLDLLQQGARMEMGCCRVSHGKAVELSGGHPV